MQSWSKRVRNAEVRGSTPLCSTISFNIYGCRHWRPYFICGKLGEARALNLPDESIDLALTSRPYLNAIDYIRSKFSLVRKLAEPACL